MPLLQPSRPDGCSIPHGAEAAGREAGGLPQPASTLSGASSSRVLGRLRVQALSSLGAPSFFGAACLALAFVVASLVSLPAFAGSSEGSVLSAAGFTTASEAVASSGTGELPGSVSKGTFLQSISPHNDEPSRAEDLNAQPPNSSGKDVVSLANAFNHVVEPVANAGEAVAMAAADMAAAVSAAGGAAAPMAQAGSFIQMHTNAMSRAGGEGEGRSLSVRGSRVLGQELGRSVSNKRQNKSAKVSSQAVPLRKGANKVARVDQVPSTFSQQTVQGRFQRVRAATHASVFTSVPTDRSRSTPAQDSTTAPENPQPRKSFRSRAQLRRPMPRPAQEQGEQATQAVQAEPSQEAHVRDVQQQVQDAQKQAEEALQQAEEAIDKAQKAQEALENAHQAQEAKHGQQDEHTLRPLLPEGTEEDTHQPPVALGSAATLGAKADVSAELRKAGMQQWQDLRLQQQAIDIELQHLHALEAHVAAQERRAAEILGKIDCASGDGCGPCETTGVHYPPNNAGPPTRPQPSEPETVSPPEVRPMPEPGHPEGQEAAPDTVSPPEVSPMPEPGHPEGQEAAPETVSPPEVRPMPEPGHPEGQEAAPETVSPPEVSPMPEPGHPEGQEAAPETVSPPEVRPMPEPEHPEGQEAAPETVSPPEVSPMPEPEHPEGQEAAPETVSPPEVRPMPEPEHPEGQEAVPETVSPPEVSPMPEPEHPEGQEAAPETVSPPEVSPMPEPGHPEGQEAAPETVSPPEVSPMPEPGHPEGQEAAPETVSPPEVSPMPEPGHPEGQEAAPETVSPPEVSPMPEPGHPEGQEAAPETVSPPEVSPMPEPGHPEGQEAAPETVSPPEVSPMPEPGHPEGQEAAPETVSPPEVRPMPEPEHPEGQEAVPETVSPPEVSPMPEPGHPEGQEAAPETVSPPEVRPMPEPGHPEGQEAAPETVSPPEVSPMPEPGHPEGQEAAPETVSPPEVRPMPEPGHPEGQEAAPETVSPPEVSPMPEPGHPEGQEAAPETVSPPEVSPMPEPGHPEGQEAAPETVSPPEVSPMPEPEHPEGQEAAPETVSPPEVSPMPEPGHPEEQEAAPETVSPPEVSPMPEPEHPEGQEAAPETVSPPEVSPMPEPGHPEEQEAAPETVSPPEVSPMPEPGHPEGQEAAPETVSPPEVSPMPEPGHPEGQEAAPETSHPGVPETTPEAVPPAEQEAAPVPETAPSTGAESDLGTEHHNGLEIEEKASHSNASSDLGMGDMLAGVPSTANLEEFELDEYARVAPQSKAAQQVRGVPVQETRQCETDASACKGDENAVNKVNEYLSGLGSLNCPCRQLLANLVCNLIVNQSDLASSGAARIDTPDAGTATLTLSGATCTALKQSCPQVAAQTLLATTLPSMSEQATTGAAAAVPVQFRATVPQGDSVASFVETQAAVKGDLKLQALTRAAQKVGARVSESIIRKVRMQRQIQADAVAGFAELVQSRAPLAATAASFFGDSSQQTMWTFASTPAEACRLVDSVIPVPMPVDTNDRRISKVVVQGANDETIALSLV
ncbi:hypothetical protein NCLIV_010780 [Neospora caninum Liverpool]|uniref:IgA-specific serine endopeptidase n=1 Tax=Neospora caninum (strain Liverpool) TaxID=572307 RepID=F0VAC1_NEOCL|nr:hypothetical protein NCLIV_010780 [Neospora caninum Liverpool]CBZ50610.1 hypothetical protein NCLIV_010780 [Neospora caninum Liverpool]CEL65222.1 TPA: IgA-specific serine endopeptidase [Neospora caninum Liverpool]|eukprot:XP_003880643.1 hypothetical protein NCLIV_010780 [Neospora caninum Liverpool]